MYECGGSPVSANSPPPRVGVVNHPAFYFTVLVGVLLWQGRANPPAASNPTARIGNITLNVPVPAPGVTTEPEPVSPIGDTPDPPPTVVLGPPEPTPPSDPTPPATPPADPTPPAPVTPPLPSPQSYAGPLRALYVMPIDATPEQRSLAYDVAVLTAFRIAGVGWHSVTADPESLASVGATVGMTGQTPPVVLWFGDSFHPLRVTFAPSVKSVLADLQTAIPSKP